MTRRGDILLVSLDPAVGNEQGKVRPAVVVSNDGMNAQVDRGAAGVITVVPITSNVARVYSFQVFLRAGDFGLEIDSKAQSEQVRSISARRIVRIIGRVDPQRMAELDDALRLHLHL